MRKKVKANAGEAAGEAVGETAAEAVPQNVTEEAGTRQVPGKDGLIYVTTRISPAMNKDLNEACHTQGMKKQRIIAAGIFKILETLRIKKGL